MSHPDLFDDDILLGLLSTAIDAADPVPHAAVRAAVAAFELGHADGELAALVAESRVEDHALLLRSEAEITTLTFVSSRLRVEIEIDRARHVVGVISPPEATVIEVEESAGELRHLGTTQSDDLGRFQADVGGLCRLRIGSGAHTVVTSWFYC